MQRERRGRVVRLLLDRFGREKVDVIAITRSPGGLVHTSYGQFLQGGNWDLEKAEIFRRHDGSIEGFLAFDKATWGFELQDHTKLFPAFAAEFGLDGISTTPLDGDGDRIAEIAGRLGLPQHGKPPKLNPGCSYCKMLFMRGFQKVHGVETCRKNQNALRHTAFPDYEIDEGWQSASASRCPGPTSTR